VAETSSSLLDSLEFTATGSQSSATAPAKAATWLPGRERDGQDTVDRVGATDAAGCENRGAAENDRYRESLFPWANVRSRRLLDTTNREDRVMAAPAISGLSRPAAASGKAAML
jgi:hypothetical protein